MFSGNSIKGFFKHKITLLALKLLIPLAIVIYLLLKLDLHETKSILLKTNLWIFTVSFFLLCLRNLIGAYRSKILLAYKKLSYPLGVLTKYYFVGNFVNFFLPEIVGRDIARGFYLYNSSERKKEAISSIVVERFMGTAALMLLSLFSVGLAVITGVEVIQNRVIQVIVGAFGLCCIVMILFFYEKTDRFLERLIPSAVTGSVKTAVEFIRDVITYNKAPSVLCYTFGISLVFQFIGVIATYLVALSLGSTVSFIYFLILLPVIWVAGMMPVSINGIGVREGAFVFLFSTTGMAAEMALAISLLWLVQNIGLGVMGGIVLLFKGNGISRIRNNRITPEDR
ncbi:lysylphosphatidylglycerol synthase transmembrane domain-containing protein [Candidatus Latescibacterota bacterium]